MLQASDRASAATSATSRYIFTPAAPLSSHMAAASAVLALCLAMSAVPSLADYSWDQILNQKSMQSGDVSCPHSAGVRWVSDTEFRRRQCASLSCRHKLMSDIAD